MRANAPIATKTDIVGRHSIFSPPSNLNFGDELSVRPATGKGGRAGKSSVSAHWPAGNFCGRPPKGVGLVIRAALSEWANLEVVCLEGASYDQHVRNPSAVAVTFATGPDDLQRAFSGRVGVTPAATETRVVEKIGKLL